MHAARETLEDEIRRVEETRKMLLELAGTIELGPPQRGGETWKDETLMALKHAASIVLRHRQNLEHCGEMWDAKVTE